MKTKIIFASFIVVVIAAVGVVVFFVSQPQQEELLPQTFAQLPERPKIVDEFHHGHWINSVAISPADSSLIASAGQDGTVNLWKKNKPQKIFKFFHHPDKMPSIGFSPNGKLLVIASYKTLIIWDVASGTRLNSIEPSSNNFAFSPDGHQLATVRNEVKLWDIRNPKKITQIATLPFDEAHQVKGGWACAVDISPDGKWIAAGYSNGTINVWGLGSKQFVKTLETPFYDMDFLKFSPNNKYMVAGGRDLEGHDNLVEWCIMWEVPSWQHKGEVLRGDVENSVFSPDGKMCVSVNNWAHLGRGAEIWSTANGAPIASLQTEATDVSFSQDGTLIVTGGKDGYVRVWNITQSQLDLTKVRNDVVRLIYYLPTDKEHSPNITQKIDLTIRKVQKHYADEMERHGFGRKTFTFETDENGKAKIYRMNENQVEIHDLQLNDIWLVFVDEKNDSHLIDSMVKRHLSTAPSYLHFDNTFMFTTRRKGNDNDKVWMRNIKGFTGDGIIIYGKKNGFDWKLTAYSLKPLFKVLDDQHSLHKLERCEAEWLDRSRFFNPNQPFFDKRPEIKMDVQKTGTDSRIFKFTVTDEDGIHQLLLFVPEEIKRKYHVNKLQGCQALNGKKKATVEFEISNPEIKKGEIRMMDMHGNIASREFKIRAKASEPEKEQ